MKAQIDSKELYKLAYRAVRLRLLAAAAHAEYDYTIYDGFCPDDDGYNDQGQDRQAWNDAVDQGIYEDLAMAQRAEELLTKIEVPVELLAIAAQHHERGKYARDKYPMRNYVWRANGVMYIKRMAKFHAQRVEVKR